MMSGRDEIIREWLGQTIAVPGVCAVWLFGSMAGNTVVAGSDIDLRVAVNDQGLAFWDRTREASFCGGFRRYMISENRDDFMRLVVYPGYVVDLGVELLYKKKHHTPTYPIKTLWARTGIEVVGASEKAYNFKERHAVDPPSKEEVQKWIAETLVIMLQSPSLMERNASIANQYYGHIYRVELLKLLYRLEGVEYAMGYKHLDEWMSKESLELAYGGNSLWLSMFEVLRRLCDKIGMEYPQAFVDMCIAKYDQAAGRVE